MVGFGLFMRLCWVKKKSNIPSLILQSGFLRLVPSMISYDEITAVDPEHTERILIQRFGMRLTDDGGMSHHQIVSEAKLWSLWTESRSSRPEVSLHVVLFHWFMTDRRTLITVTMATRDQIIDYVIIDGIVFRVFMLRCRRVWLIVLWQSMRVWGEDNYTDIHEIQICGLCADLVPNSHGSPLVFRVFL